jgi:hypothetical protein
MFLEAALTGGFVVSGVREPPVIVAGISQGLDDSAFADPALTAFVDHPTELTAKSR